ncbi:VOC family protein [Streptomyces liliifuscus]|uniref:VOC family protein n=1 Tax=Streptomyces liliifuscus TaxID=2797636 RepID=A0A7T7L3C4_9ACTN|nr:VOC family protein [Streptomyces liliifuscus]QQM45596.1 VOC family protein [Streptomyces liliifuscus]
MSRIFGRIAQIGYVVRDIEASMEHWVAQGVGPWFYLERCELDHFRYRGADSALEMSAAVANSGDIQIELIQQRNDAPSLYKDFLDAGHEGAQHVAYWTKDYQELYDRALALGYTVGQEGSIGGGRFAYLDTEKDPGTVIEISDIGGTKGELFKAVRDMAADWDGSTPIHRLG